ncbi:MAG: intein-containing RctB family protein [Desulfurococcales archaeon]|nr:intein-containing RctB family protein [Desulfurococcales archaeon]
MNCLSPNTEVITEHGYWVSIKNLPKIFKNQRLKVYGENEDSTRIMFVAIRELEPDEKAVRITTETGKILEGSTDHPILTSEGYKRLDELKIGDYIVTYPFEGVEYEEHEDILLREEDFKEENPQIISYLKKKGFLPLRMNDPKIGILARILGYAMGDGHLGYESGRLVLSFYGRKQDLEKLKIDLEKLGVKSYLAERRRKYSIDSVSGHYEGESVSAHLKVWSRAFASLLEKLGMPKGRKTEVTYRVPRWIRNASRWVKRNYLAGLFGSDGSIVSFKGQTPLPINITQSKSRELEENLWQFMNDLSELLLEFDVKSTIYPVKTVDGNKVTLRLALVGEDSIRNFLGKIGYEYSVSKKIRGLHAYAYLSYKARIKTVRMQAAEQARIVYSETGSIRKAYGQVAELVNKRFVERAVYEGTVNSRPPKDFPTFEEYVDKHGLSNGFVLEKVEKIELVNPNYREFYDIGVYHESHNFIANGIVVHNCGVRVMVTNLDVGDVRPRLRELIDELFRNVPSGLGSTGKVRVSIQELDRVLDEGVEWAISRGYGWSDDPLHIEEHGSWGLADSSKVSRRAKQRGAEQLGTLGSGNHFLEVQVVDKIYDERIAKAFGFTHEGQVVVMVHTGSRGLGHQVASDYLQIMERAMRKYGTVPPDRELASVPYSSQEAQDYIRAMAAAANFAWTNRQLISYWTRESFGKVFHTDPDKLGLKLVYDVAHNIAKIEEHVVDGKRMKLIVHRKGATRAFPPGHPEIPHDYKDVGQPVLIPGSMGTASYILAGSIEGAKSWYTAPHGAGRWMSRKKALRTMTVGDVLDELSKQGIYIRAANKRVIVEEAPEAYKNVDKVAEVANAVGIGKLVVRLRPLGVAKG